MALVERQNNLFAAEDWKVAYKAYSQVNFQAYDFDTIRSGLVDYIRTNFPENFNDYIESSEFIAIIELLAYLSQSLAFRMDLNSRENFLETAERRDSVFKLARMLGYNPKRNLPASGLMKVVAVRTNEPIRDSLGNDLNNVSIFWDDANNPDSYEQFITVLNSAMYKTNRYSTPVKSGKVNNISTDIYELNTQLSAPIAYNFDLTVNGVPRSFQVVNPTFQDGGVFEEQHPDPVNNFNLIYRNDGTGISSFNTGFFLMFKQGIMTSQDFNYTVPVESRVQDVTATNINETDVFLQEIDTAGIVVNKWEKIPNTVGQTLNYNSLALGTRNLYSVENLNNEGIRIKYPDGNFGNIPYGIYRLYYRTSAAENFTLYPEDARNIRINIPYQNAQGLNYTLTLTFSLQESVSNSLPPESLTAIKQRAPQVYYTQNRMISAQDYNIFPFSQSTNITKLKAINKTHAGHSRYIDINDPTGAYQNLETFANDGALYTEIVNGTSSITINENNTTAEAASSSIPLILKDKNLNNFVYEQFRNTWEVEDDNKFSLSTLGITWKVLPVVSGAVATGYMLESFSTPGVTNVLNNTTSGFKMFKENNFIKFSNPAAPGEYKWVRIVSIDNNGLLSSGLSTSRGPILLSSPVKDGWQAVEYIATMRKTFTSSEYNLIKSELDNKRTFGLGYEPENDVWYVISNSNLNKTSAWSADNYQSTSGLGEDSSWLALFTYTALNSNSYKFIVTLRGQQYVVQSRNDLKFYNINNVKVADSVNQSSRDLITFTTLNYKPATTETFTWTTDDTAHGNVWQSDETFETYKSVSYDTGLPLRDRSIKWYDVEIDYVTSGAIFTNGNYTNNIFVNSARVPLNPYFYVNTESGTATTSNITLANNSGRITHWPANINIPFSNTTFGDNIIDTTTGNVVYKDYNFVTGQFEIYQANSSGSTYSFGPAGTSYDPSANGRIRLANANVSAETGNLIITDMFDNHYTYAIDSTFIPTQDKLVVKYKTQKTQLEQNIDWSVVSPIKYDDGYTDNRKVIVVPIDTDDDLVPDRPMQFREFVGVNDLVFFEYYTDFDGYTYDRPVTGTIVDYRYETELTVDYESDEVRPTALNTGASISDTAILVVNNINLVPAAYTSSAITNASGLVIYDYTNEKVYQMVESSVSSSTPMTPVETTDYFVRNGRSAGQNTALIGNDQVVFKWKHVAPKDVRIDPSISNIIEVVVLTTGYYSEIQKYKNVPGTEFPLPPTGAELANEFAALEEFRSASDSLVYKSAEFKLLFGNDAAPENQAKFRIVKLAGTTLTDNEIKSRVIKAFNTFFEITNWEYGETFYFTELSSFVHQQLGSNIGSIVIIPKNSRGSFGDLFQIKADPNELFLNTATVNDIEIVDKISSQTLRADR